MENFDVYRLDMQSLRIFLSIMETGSFSRTAELFGMTQSTISHSVDRLRKTLGDPLFVKVGRGTTPTQAAHRIAVRAQTILHEMESLAAPESFDAAKETKPFFLGIPSPAVLQDVKMAQAILGHTAPHAKLHLGRLAPRDRVVEMLTLEEADLAIAISGIRYPPTLTHVPYGQDDLVIFYDATVRGPILTEQCYAAARHGAINHGSRAKGVVDTVLETFNITRDIALVSPTVSMLGDLIRGTDIVITMPKRLRTSAYKGLSYCPLPFAMPPVRYDLVWHRRFENSGRNMWYRRLLLDCAAEIYQGAQGAGLKNTPSPRQKLPL